METDEMELDTIGDRKTALFVIISDTDDTFNFVVSILYTQLFNLLCDKADDEYGGWCRSCRLWYRRCPCRLPLAVTGSAR